MELSAYLCVAVLGVAGLFQLALAAGAPWGAAAWGGTHPGVLPVRYRIGSVVAAVVVYPVVALYVLDGAGVVEVGMPASRLVLGGLTGLFMLGAVANAASPSRVERPWAIANLVIAGCCLLIVLGT